MSREMVNSGIPWIGEIPKDWQVCFIKQVMRNKSIKGYPNEEVLSLYRDYGVVPKDSRSDNHNVTSEDTSSYKFVEVGDFVINKMKAWQGSMAVSDYQGIISPAYYICRFVTDDIDRKYVHYLLRNDSYKSEYMRLSSGLRVGQWDLNIDDFLRIKMVFPSLAEQQKIANFLDRKCAEVDKMIALQEQIIEELKAYKQSVITEAVTKGLNPDAPMRDSGIEWIGQIPEHWKVEPLKYNFNRRSERNNPIITTERLSLSIDKGVTLYSEKTTNLDRFKEDFTQYQLAYPNDIVLNCMNMIVGAVGLSKYLGCVSPVYYVIYPSNSNVDSEYYSYLLNTPTIRGVYYSYGKGIYAIERGEGRVNTCRLKVSYDDFGRFDIPIPPIEEQKDIVLYIREKCTDIESLIQTKLTKIDSLKEYKKSIIYEYVTGKREVNE